MSSLSRMSLPLRIALFAALLSAAVVLLRPNLAWVPLYDPIYDTGGASASAFLIDTAFFWGFIASALTFRHRLRFTRLGWFDQGVGWLIRSSVAFAMMVVWGCLAIILIMTLGQQLISPQAMIGQAALSLLAGLFSGALSLGVGLVTQRLDVRGLLHIGVFVFALGLALAGALATDPRWLTEAISFLGADAGAAAFNLAFILGGFLLLALLTDIFDDLLTLRERGIFTSPHLGYLRALGVLGGLLLAGIGAFVYEGPTLLLHNISAHAALACFFLAMLIAPRLLGVLGQPFARASLLCAALCAALGLAYLLGLLAFGLMELGLLIVSIAWIVALQIASAHFIRQHDPRLLEVIGQNA